VAGVGRTGVAFLRSAVSIVYRLLFTYRNVCQWVVVVLVLRLPGDRSNRFSRSVVTDARVCVIRPTIAIKEDGNVALSGGGNPITW